MDWSKVSEFRCPDCPGRLQLLKVRRIFLCFGCRFAIGFEKRRELAAKYPAYVPAKTLSHLLEVFPGVASAERSYLSGPIRRWKSEKQELFMRNLREVTGAFETRATVDAVYGP